ncbi:MAG: hypothetical protein AB8H12_07090 [Lewinella sp.]
MEFLRYRRVPIYIDYLGTPPQKKVEAPDYLLAKIIEWLANALFLLVFACSIVGCVYFYLQAQHTQIAADEAIDGHSLVLTKLDSLSVLLGYTQQREADLRLTAQLAAVSQDSLHQIVQRQRGVIVRFCDTIHRERIAQQKLQQAYAQLAECYHADRRQWADSLTHVRNALAYLQFAQLITLRSSFYRHTLPLLSSNREGPQVTSTAPFFKVPDGLTTWNFKEDLQVFSACIMLASLAALVWALWHMGRQQKGRFRTGKRHP